MDQFDGWRALLAHAQNNKTKAGMRAAMMAAGDVSFDAETPLSGYFRHRRHKDGPYEAVAIWRKAGGDLSITWGNDRNVPVARVWPYCAWNPVTFEAWSNKTKHGQDWPDVHTSLPPAEDEPAAVADWRSTDAPPPVGDNGAPPDVEPVLDEVATFKRDIDKAATDIAAYTTIDSDEKRDRSQSLRSMLLELSRKADNRREELKRPHLEAGREIDGKWQPLVKAAKVAADAINTAQSAWATVKLKRRQAEDEKARVQALADAKAAEVAAEAGHVAPPIQPAAPEPERVSPVTSFRGGTGRASTEKPVEVITAVTDWTALFSYFREDSEVKDLLLKKARKVLKDTGEIPPGVTTETQAKVT